MKSKTKRVEVLFEPNEYKKLKNEAQLRSISLGEFIRNAVRLSLKSSQADKRKAFEELTSGKFAIEFSSWEEIEDIIKQSHIPTSIESEK